MISASMLTDRVSVLMPVIDRDNPFGAQSPVYNCVAELWASVKFAKGRRALDSGEVWQQNTVVVTVRWNNIIQDHSHIGWDGKEYQIDSINRDRRDGSITMTCTRIDQGNPLSE